MKDIRKSNERDEQTTEWTLKIGHMKRTRGYYYTDAQSRARTIPKSAYHSLIPSSSIPPCSQATMLTSNHYYLQKPNPDEAHRNKLHVTTKSLSHSSNPHQISLCCIFGIPRTSARLQIIPELTANYCNRVERQHSCSEQNFRVNTRPDSLRRLCVESEESFRSKRLWHGVGALEYCGEEREKEVSEAMAMANTERRKAASRKHGGLNKP